ncbi:MAG: hypothetical protein ABT940_02795 [Alphaproteobacteria bacterium]
MTVVSASDYLVKSGLRDCVCYVSGGKVVVVKGSLPLLVMGAPLGGGGIGVGTVAGTGGAGFLAMGSPAGAGPGGGIDGLAAAVTAAAKKIFALGGLRLREKAVHLRLVRCYWIYP